jgi:hypothetical protein
MFARKPCHTRHLPQAIAGMIIGALQSGWRTIFCLLGRMHHGRNMDTLRFCPSYALHQLAAPSRKVPHELKDFLCKWRKVPQVAETSVTPDVNELPFYGSLSRQKSLAWQRSTAEIRLARTSRKLSNDSEERDLSTSRTILRLIRDPPARSESAGGADEDGPRRILGTLLSAGASRVSAALSKAWLDRTEAVLFSP